MVGGLGDGLHIASRAAGGQRITANQRRQRLPLDVIHRDEMLALAETDLVNRDDVRVLERAVATASARKRFTDSADACGPNRRTLRATMRSRLFWRAR